MQILNPGKHMNGEWTGEFVCTNRGNGNSGCNAELELTQSDLYQSQSSARDETTYYVSFLCPCCGAETDLTNSDGYRHNSLPSSISERSVPGCNRTQVRAAQASIAAGTYISPREIG